MLTQAQELEQKTRAYWRISLAFNNQSPELISAIRSIGQCSYIVYNTHAQRPIAKCAQKLRAELIVGESIITTHEAKILKLVRG